MHSYFYCTVIFYDTKNKVFFTSESVVKSGKGWVKLLGDIIEIMDGKAPFSIEEVEGGRVYKFPNGKAEIKKRLITCYE